VILVIILLKVIKKKRLIDMADDYEIVPEKDFDSLKRDVEKIRNNPLGESAESKDLKASIDRLNDSITNLLLLFKTASESIKAESHDTEVMSKKMLPLFDKVERLSEQNEKIAKGIVALAEMFDELKAKQQQRVERPRTNFSESSPQMNFGMQQPGPMPSQQMPMPPSMPSPDDFPSPFGPPTQGSQPLPRMQMPQTPQPPQKKKMFGF
jgi:hypothetical protein